MWSDNRQNQIRAMLLSDRSEDLIWFMRQKSMMAPTDGTSPDAIQAASDLGWVDGQTAELTAEGIAASDSCREYLFWLERDKALPFDGAAPHLTASYFKDRAVMEIGPGMGAHLLSLSAAGSQVHGIEPVEAYTSMGRIFAEREGLPPADIRNGRAEVLPFGDKELDTVLCVSAHQYFEIRPALSEIARVLRPGGELIIVGASFWSYCSNNIGCMFQGMGQARAYVLTLINTMSYTAAGKRIVPARSSEVSTTRPIYPSRTAMHRWLRTEGLAECSPDCMVDVETCFHYVKT